MIELIHPELASVSKKDIKAKLAQTLKSKDENISIFGLKTKFGGGRSTGFALIYDSLDARKKFDSKKMLRRVRTGLRDPLWRPTGLAGPRNLSVPNVRYYIGRLPRQGQARQKAEEGNQGPCQEGQRCCQGQGCSVWRQEEVSKSSLMCY